MGSTTHGEDGNGNQGADRYEIDTDPERLDIALVHHWLSTDVYVAPAHRGRGLGVRLATAVRDHLAPYELKRTLLATLDAHELYAKVGFAPVTDPTMLMVLSAER